jgi:hypothetical protein
MKRGLFVFTVAMMAAGVASALTLAPAIPAPPRPAQVASKPSPDPVPGGAKFALEARQAPVPLLVKARTPIELRMVNAAMTGPQTAATGPESAAKAGDAGPESAAKAGDEAGEGSARTAAEADGYRSVKVLRKGADGLWYAEALRGRTKVLLTVDAQGNVSYQ